MIGGCSHGIDDLYECHSIEHQNIYKYITGWDW